MQALDCIAEELDKYEIWRFESVERARYYHILAAEENLRLARLAANDAASCAGALRFYVKDVAGIRIEAAVNNCVKSSASAVSAADSSAVIIEEVAAYGDATDAVTVALLTRSACSIAWKAHNRTYAAYRIVRGPSEGDALIDRMPACDWGV